MALAVRASDGTVKERRCQNIRDTGRIGKPDRQGPAGDKSRTKLSIPDKRLLETGRRRAGSRLDRMTPAW
jgi:hypothetical protein